MKPITTRFVGAFVCIALVSSMAAMPAAAQTEGERFLVELDAEGNADVSVTFAYDLESENELAAFEELQENETARTETTARFENRMKAVAENASAATDREMSVGKATIDFERADDVGLITLSVAWSNLASVDDDRLTVTEPFASGFEPDRTFVVASPDGYGVTSAEPSPSESDETSATWAAGTSLQEFEAVVARTDTTEADGEETDDGEGEEGSPDGDATDDSPGFGIVAATVALLAAALLGVRRRG
jgi:PGF-CTERM protein